MAVASAGPYASLHTSLHTDNNASTPPLSFLQAGCPFCRPTNSVKEWKALHSGTNLSLIAAINISDNYWCFDVSLFTYYVSLFP